jgi:DNA-binding CsgD family transcriptional regulator
VVDLLGEVHLEQGEFDHAERYLEESLALFREAQHLWRTAGSLAALARLALLQGDAERARARFEESLALGQYVSDARLITTAQIGMAWAGHATGDVQPALEWLSDSLTRAHELGLTSALAECLEGIAVVAGASTPPEQTAWLLGAADAIRTRSHHPLSPVVRGHYARLLRPIQGRLALEHWDRAWAEGRTVSVAEAVSRAHAVVDLASRAPTPAPPSGLSPREIEVLGLLVEGQSNQEIAAALFISPRTAANHVANIMIKLGVESRTAAATWAVKQGIV